MMRMPVQMILVTQQRDAFISEQIVMMEMPVLKILATV